MTFLNAALLFGAGLAVVPVLLHLLMRHKPKKMLFPALRLLQLRKKTNTRRMRLKHLLLLLLRVLMIVALAVALARPTLPAADYALTLREWLTLLGIGVAAVAAYVAVGRVLRARQLPPHEMRYRRTVLRGAVAGGSLLLMLLLVCWPYGARIAAAWKDPQPPVQENFPVSAVLVFDVSPSMAYRQDNLTRLDLARRYADELIARLPASSQIAVTHNATEDPVVFLADSAAARGRTETLAVTERTFPLNARVAAAISLQQRDRERTLADLSGGDDQADRFLREVYLFTDMSRHGWQSSAAARVQAEMEQAPWLAVYLVDVSPDGPRNTSLSIPQLSDTALPRGDTLVVTAEVQAHGASPGPQTVELYLRSPDGKLTKQDQRTVEFGEEATGVAEFAVPATAPGLLEGELRLVASDPLGFDDRRYFAAEVVSPPRVLVVSEERSRGEFLRTVLAPDELRKTGKARFEADWLPASALSGTDLGQTDLMCLLSVPAPSDSAWRTLETFVDKGGGLLIALGSKQIQPFAYQSTPAARNLMPGELLAPLKFTPPEFLDLSRKQHPLVARFDEVLPGGGRLINTPVAYRWKVQPYEDARTIISYTDAEAGAALLERSVGRGRVLLLTTSVLPGEWNDLAYERIEFIVLTNFMMQYLNRQNSRPLNFFIGDVPRIPLPAGLSVEGYKLTKPNLAQSSGRVEPGAAQLNLPPADVSGHYDLTSTPPGLRTGYSVNLPPEQSDLTPLTPAELDDLFGEGRYGVARSLEELEPVVRDRRLGQEMVPPLLLLLFLLFSAEQIFANRFYDHDSAELPAASPPARAA